MVLPDGTLFGEGVKTRLKEHLMEECNLHTIVRLPNSVFKPYASIGTNLLFFEKGTPTKDIWFYEHRVPEGQKAYSMTKPIRLEHFQGCIDWWGGKERKGREETPQAWRVTAEEVKARGYNLDIKNPHTVADDHGDPETLLADLAARRSRDGGLARPVEGDPRRGARPMNAERLLAHYRADRRRARRDCPPAPLHSRSGRARQARAAGPERRTGVGIAEADREGEGAAGEGGRDQKPKAVCRLLRSELPFDMPTTWRWAQLGDIDHDHCTGRQFANRQIIQRTRRSGVRCDRQTVDVRCRSELQISSHVLEFARSSPRTASCF